MRRFVKFLLLLGFGLAACSSDPTENVVPPMMDIAGLTLGGPRAPESRARLDLRLTNPNTFAIGVERLDFDLVIGERYFASGVVEDGIALPAGANVLIPVMMTIGTDDLSVTMLALGGNIPLDYRLIGEADLRQVPDHTLIFDYYGQIEPVEPADAPNPQEQAARTEHSWWSSGDQTLPAPASQYAGAGPA
jgi:hypothetical protein